MSTLASLLVRDHVVPVRRIEEAIERQVVSGVALATALADLGAAPENVLAAYAAAAAGLDPLPRQALEHPDAELVATLDAERAGRLRVVPVARLPEGVVVAVERPLEAAETEELEGIFGAPMLQALVLEPRMAVALSAHYGIEPPRKMARIARKLDRQPDVELPEVAPPEEARLDPLRRRRISLPGRGDQEEDVLFEPTGTQRFGAAPATDEPTKQPAASPDPETQPPHERSRKPVESDPSPPSAETRSEAADEPAESHAEVGDEPTPHEPADGSRPLVQRARAVALGGTPQAATPAASPAEATGGAPVPLGVGEALEALDACQERDDVVEVLWRIAGSSLRRLAVFTVRGGTARLLKAWPGGALLPSASVPLCGALEEARVSGGPVLHPEPTTEDAALLEALGERIPGPVLAVPVTIRGRVVLLVGGDREGERFGLQDVAELLAVVPRVSETFERVIRERKLQAFRAAPGTERTAALDGRRPGRLTVRSGPDASTDSGQGGASWGAAPRPVRRRRATVLGVPTSEALPRTESGERRRAQREAPPSSERLDDEPRDDDVRQRTPAKKAAPSSSRRPASFDRLGVPRTPPPPPMLRREGTDAGVYVGGGQQQDTLPLLRRSSAPPPRGREGARRSPSGASEPPLPRSEGRHVIREEVVRLPGHVSTPPPERESERPTDQPPPRSLRDEGHRVIVDMGDQVDALVRQLLNSSPDEPHPATDRLVTLGEAALPALVQAFPGPLWFDRRHPHRRRPRGRNVSPIARALVAFGRRAAPYLVGLLADPDPNTRYYALLVAQEIPDARLVEPVGARLLDEDAGVRGLAADVLRRFARFTEQTAEVLESLRYRASDRRRDVGERVLALRALGALRDQESLEALLDALGSRDEHVALAAHDALVTITRQDFGRSVRRWRSWVERNRNRHRVEWLIDALTHPEESIRKAAGRELGETTRQFFGFHPSLPKRDREVCQRKYRAWWEREGRTRFTA